jgi:hypothetical protein
MMSNYIFICEDCNKPFASVKSLLVERFRFCPECEVNHPDETNIVFWFRNED